MHRWPQDIFPLQKRPAPPGIAFQTPDLQLSVERNTPRQEAKRASNVSLPYAPHSSASAGNVSRVAESNHHSFRGSVAPATHCDGTLFRRVSEPATLSFLQHLTL